MISLSLRRQSRILASTRDQQVEEQRIGWWWCCAPDGPQGINRPSPLFLPVCLGVQLSGWESLVLVTALFSHTSVTNNTSRSQLGFRSYHEQKCLEPKVFTVEIGATWCSELLMMFSYPVPFLKKKLTIWTLESSDPFLLIKIILGSSKIFTTHLLNIYRVLVTWTTQIKGTVFALREFTLKFQENE